jgi:Fur family ferric uptake transcriptional regulator
MALLRPPQSPRADEARRRIRAAGERLTAPRAAVLGALLASDTALTHHELERVLQPVLDVDRVTVYRVLDWLVALGLAHRIAGDDRAWRYRATRGPPHATHAHFTCRACGRTVCLEDVAVPSAVRLPRGYRSQKVDLTVSGLCAACR